MTAATPGRPTMLVTVIVALLAGYVVLLTLFPSAVLHSNPPQCLSTFNYRAPCARSDIAAFGYASWSFAADAATAGAFGFALRRTTRRRGRNGA